MKDTKIRLIEAAGEVFAREGYRSATVRAICKRAGAHVGAVNYHFRDKAGLYAAVLAYSHESAVIKYPPDLGLKGDATPEDKLRAFIRSFLLRVLDETATAWHGKLMAREIAEPSSALDQVVDSSIRPLYDYLAAIIRELLPVSHRGKNESPDLSFLCAMSIVGQCLQHYLGKSIIASLRPESFEPGDIDRICDHITRFSLGGIRELKNQ
jgi:AcrR family transcriptional regulator